MLVRVAVRILAQIFGQVFAKACDVAVRSLLPSAIRSGALVMTGRRGQVITIMKRGSPGKIGHSVRNGNLAQTGPVNAPLAASGNGVRKPVVHGLLARHAPSRVNPLRRQRLSLW